MRKRSETLHWLKHYKRTVETMHSQKIAFLRVDNAPEYVEGEVWKFCDEEGIQYEQTVPEAPQQNGKSERHNYTFERMGRAMLIDGDLPIFFWPFSILAAGHIKNRVPHSALPAKTTPYEMWYGRKPSIAHIRPFGSHCTARIVNPKLNKFEPRGEAGCFLGYAQESKGYIFWHTDSRTAKIRRDLTFHGPPSVAIGKGGVDYTPYAPLWDNGTTMTIQDGQINLKPSDVNYHET